MEQYREPIYPIEPWDVTETEYNPQNNYRNETTFALSNGYIGTRGTYEEACNGRAGREFYQWIL